MGAITELSGADSIGHFFTGHGEISVLRLPPGSPRAPTLVAAYVAAVTAPAASYSGPSIGMIVTIYDPDVNPQRAAELRDTPGRRAPGRWYGVERQINDVYAAPAFRGGRIQGVSAPVAMGRFLREAGLLELHSGTRSVKGDRWAADVGGVIPPLLERLSGDLDAHMEPWLEDLNRAAA
jgi:hypothetical protein